MNSTSNPQLFPVLDHFSANLLPKVQIQLSGDDLKIVEKIKSVVKEFCQKLDLPESTIILSNAPGWGSFYSYFPIPTKCLSEETRAKIYEEWIKVSPYPIDKEFIQNLDKVASIEKEIFNSTSHEEWSMLIGHELGHAWLNVNFKAFNSQSIQVEGEKVASLKHDRAQEQICDFIGVYLTSPEAGIEAMKKEAKNPSVQESEDDSHPSFKIRIDYMSKWQKDPRLSKPLTKELLLDVGGADFQEAITIYAKYGK